MSQEYRWNMSMDSKITALESSVSRLQGIEGRVNQTVLDNLKTIEDAVSKALIERLSKISLLGLISQQQSVGVQCGGSRNAEQSKDTASSTHDTVCIVIDELDKETSEAEEDGAGTGESNDGPLAVNSGGIEDSDSEDGDESEDLVPSEVSMGINL
ncbi:hypothetical protein Bca101_082847 [Brassica carinata]